MQSDIKLIALDMDGTVLTDEKTVSARTIAAVRAAQAKGVHVVPATGRAATGIPPAFMEIGGMRYSITANGARVLDLETGECLAEKLIPLPLALAAFEVLSGYDCVLDAFQDGKAYSTPENIAVAQEVFPPVLRAYVKATRTVIPDMRAFIETQTQGIEKWTMFFREDAARDEAWAKMEAMGFEVVSSMPKNMELSAPGVHKGSGLRHLAGVLGIPLAQVMACGDGGNDTAMLSTAGLGVAMGNAEPDVLAVADYVTASNEEDGVAKAIEKFVLGV